MSALPKADASQLGLITDQFGLGQLLDPQPMAHPDGPAFGHSYVVHIAADSGARSYILTFFEADRTPPASYISLLDRCADAGLPVAPALRTVAGQPYATGHTSPAMLTRQLPGRVVYNPTSHQLRAVGRLIARLHVANASMDYLLPDLPHTVSWLRGHEQSLRGLISYRRADAIREGIRRVQSLLRRQDVSTLPAGVIHSALSRSHILFDPRGLTAVTGFESAAQGYLLYDLAAAANDWCCDASGTPDVERIVVMLKGYHAVRPLTRPELWFFPLFALYAALSNLLLRLTDADPRRIARFKSPTELTTALQRQLRSDFCIDERLFD